jgi:hypothetical protein
LGWPVASIKKSLFKQRPIQIVDIPKARKKISHPTMSIDTGAHPPIKQRVLTRRQWKLFGENNAILTFPYCQKKKI